MDCGTRDNKKCGIRYVLHGTKDDAAFEAGGSSKNNNTSDGCNSSEEDLQGFCDKYKLCIAPLSIKCKYNIFFPKVSSKILM